jgi:hypothetical protein
MSFLAASRAATMTTTGVHGTSEAKFGGLINGLVGDPVFPDGLTDVGDWVQSSLRPANVTSWE